MHRKTRMIMWRRLGEVFEQTADYNIYKLARFECFQREFFTLEA